VGAQGVNEASLAEMLTKERREEFYRRERKAAEPQPKSKDPLLHLPRLGGEKRGGLGVRYRVQGFGFRFLDLSVSFVSDFELRISDFDSVAP
jgi:hypothetical protein